MILRLLALLILFNSPALALDPSERLDESTLEERARHISLQLRCLQCQNQTIDDSDAEIAKDLRRLVRKKLIAGQSDQEILEYIHLKYGDFVLMKPPVKPMTWGLWFFPAIILVFGIVAVFIYLSKQSKRFEEDRPS